jgi:hypothetical protein
VVFRSVQRHLGIKLSGARIKVHAELTRRSRTPCPAIRVRRSS